VLVDRQEQIDQVSRRARKEGRFAFDTEFVMEDLYEPQVCLLQIATEDSVTLIDPFHDLDLAPIWALITDDKVEAVVHAGQEDLALCVQHSGKLPRRVFDVQIAAGLAGYDYPLSLQKLVQSTLHIRLHKAKTLTDWRRRPLDEAELRYAAEDVSYLLAVRRVLEAKLERRKRTSWAEEEFKVFEEETLYHRVEEEKLQRLKGTRSMQGQQLAVVRSLLTWRDGLAERLNRPARAVLKDHLLVEIARLGLTSFGDIRALRGLNMSDRNVRALGKVVKEAMETPPEQWPEPRPREAEPPREDVLIALATAVIRSYCLDYGLSYGLVATKKMIRDLIRHRTIGLPSSADDVELLNGWRGETVGALLDDVFAGRQTIRVEPGDGELVVHVTPTQEGGG
jgi:ribonuclease D